MSRKDEILRRVEEEKRAEKRREKMQARDDSYKSREMKVRTPLGCIIIPFILAAIVFYILTKLN
jgi:hypothetical protein